MKAEIVEGNIIFLPSNTTEEYAIIKWFETNINGCTQVVVPGKIGYNLYKKHPSLLKRIKSWILLFYINNISKHK